MDGVDHFRKLREWSTVGLPFLTPSTYIVLPALALFPALSFSFLSLSFLLLKLIISASNVEWSFFNSFSPFALLPFLFYCYFLLTHF